MLCAQMGAYYRAMPIGKDYKIIHLCLQHQVKCFLSLFSDVATIEIIPKKILVMIDNKFFEKR